MREKVTAFGEILFRLSPLKQDRLLQSHGFDLHVGGSELNTSVQLASLEVPVQFISALPKNDLGLKAIRELQQYKINTSHIIRKEGRMGLYFLEEGAVLRASKVIYDRSYSAYSNIRISDFNWTDILKGSEWFHWSGIIPAISKELFEVTSTVLEVAKSMGVKISCDLNYRKKLWQNGDILPITMRKLVSQCDVVVGGPDAIQEMLGLGIEELLGQNVKETIDEQMASRLCFSVMQEFPNLSHVAMTIRNAISPEKIKLIGILSDGSHSFISDSHDLHNIVDRVGSGDSFMAGIIYGLLKKIPKDETINIATALAVMKHSVRGDINCTSMDEIKMFLENSDLSILR